MLNFPHFIHPAPSRSLSLNLIESSWLFPSDTIIWDACKPIHKTSVNSFFVIAWDRYILNILCNAFQMDILHMLKTLLIYNNDSPQSYAQLLAEKSSLPPPKSHWLVVRTLESGVTRDQTTPEIIFTNK